MRRVFFAAVFCGSVFCGAQSWAALVKVVPSLQSLQKIAFDQQEPLVIRWRAVTSAGRIYGPGAQHFLAQSMRRPEWFLRNAALVVVPYAHRKWAIRWSCRLLNDPSLVVRTAAVEALRKLHAKGARPELWQKLYAKQNFRHGYSLWIRQNIVKALSTMATPKDEGRFVRILSDRDRALRPLAIAALQKLAYLNYKTPAQWDSWWSKHQKLRLTSRP